MRRVERRDGALARALRACSTRAREVSRRPSCFVSRRHRRARRGRARLDRDPAALARARAAALGARSAARFSGNGDVLALRLQQRPSPIHGIGFGDHAVGRAASAGRPVHHRDHRHARASRPRPRHGDRGGRRSPARSPSLLARVFAGAAESFGGDTDEGVARLRPRERGASSSRLVGGAYRGALNNTQTYLVMTARRPRRAACELRGRPGCGSTGRAWAAADLPAVDDQARAGSDRRSAAPTSRTRSGPSCSATTWSPSTRSAAARWPRTPATASSTTRAGLLRDGGRGRPRRASTSATARSCRARSASTRSSRSPPWPSAACALMAQDNGWEIDYDASLAAAGPRRARRPGPASASPRRCAATSRPR